MTREPRRPPAKRTALYRIATVRMRWHEPTIAYVSRRTTQGLSKKDIIRCLKRFIAREIYNALLHDHHAHAKEALFPAAPVIDARADQPGEFERRMAAA